MEQLNSFDSFFVAAESQRTPSHIAHVRIYDPRSKEGSVVRFKDILSPFRERLHLAPLFRKQLIKAPLELDNPYWIESPDFNIEYHVRHVALPNPGDWRQFCILLARLHSQAVNLALPPWEAYVIEGLDNVEGMPAGAFAVMIKMHHSIADGMTADTLLEAIHDEAAEVVDEIVPDHWRAEPVSSSMELGVNTALNPAKQPLQAVSQIRRMRAKSRRKKDFLEKYPDYNSKLNESSIFNGPVSSARVFGAGLFDLSDLKAINNSIEGATINDVVLLISSFSVTEYPRRHGRLLAEPLRAGFTMDTRSVGEYKDAANFATGIFIPVHDEIEDPVERLESIHVQTEIGKEYATSVEPDGMRDISQIAPVPVMAWGLKLVNRFQLMAEGGQAHYLITNVPGPRSPRYFVGAEVVCSFGLAPLVDGVGLVYMAGSYCDRVSISFQCCRSMMPDPEIYTDCIYAAFDKVYRAATGS